MLQEGTWIGPTLLLAQAFAMYAQNDSEKMWLPRNIPITFIHVQFQYILMDLTTVFAMYFLSIDYIFISTGY